MNAEPAVHVKSADAWQRLANGGRAEIMECFSYFATLIRIANFGGGLLLLAGNWPAQVTLAIIVSDAELNYAVTPGQPLYGVNLDGVAALGSGATGDSTLQDIVVFQCSGALITDSHLLTAAHCLDEDRDGAVDFTATVLGYFAGFQLSDRELLIELNADSAHWPASWPASDTDIAVLELLEPAPQEIPRYPLYAGDAEIGRAVVLTGYGTTGFGDTGVGDVPTEATVKRAGRNRLEAYYDDNELEIGYDFDSGDPAHNAFSFLDEESDLGFGADEVLPAGGDSGSPVLVNGAIVGVHALGTGLIESDYNDQFDRSWGEAGFATRVSAYQQFILDATDGQAQFVYDGDYTKDGALDGADFVVWQRQYRAADFPRADGDGDGTVTDADLAIWMDNFGRSTSASVAHVVPEPAAGVLLLGGFFVLRFVRCRRVSCG